MAVIQDFDPKPKAMTRRGALGMHFSAVLVALAAASLIIAGWPTWNQHRKEAVDVSAWFEVKDLTVPDFEAGTNPVISFDRVIHTELKGDWVVEVQTVSDDGFLFVCGGHGSNIYSPKDDRLPDPVTWNWLVFDQGTCDGVAPGDYRLQIRWDFYKSGWPDKSLTVVSNVFKIN